MTSRDDTPTSRSLTVLVELPVSERSGPAFESGISLPMTCEEWFSIQAALRSQPAASRDAVLEEAAKACDRKAKEWRDLDQPFAADMSDENARDIRALKNADPQAVTASTASNTPTGPAESAPSAQRCVVVPLADVEWLVKHGDCTLSGDTTTILNYAYAVYSHAKKWLGERPLP